MNDSQMLQSMQLTFVPLIYSRTASRTNHSVNLSLLITHPRRSRSITSSRTSTLKAWNSNINFTLTSLVFLSKATSFSLVILNALERKLTKVIFPQCVTPQFLICSAYNLLETMRVFSFAIIIMAYVIRRERGKRILGGVTVRRVVFRRKAGN